MKFETTVHQMPCLFRQKVMVLLQKLVLMSMLLQS